MIQTPKYGKVRILNIGCLKKREITGEHTGSLHWHWGNHCPLGPGGRVLAEPTDSCSWLWGPPEEMEECVKKLRAGLSKPGLWSLLGNRWSTLWGSIRVNHGYHHSGWGKPTSLCSMPVLGWPINRIGNYYIFPQMCCHDNEEVDAILNFVGTHLSIYMKWIRNKGQDTVFYFIVKLYTPRHLRSMESWMNLSDVQTWKICVKTTKPKRVRKNQN